ncbi:MAG: mechanosensitive ion channel domain-containing protein [Alphaproteobacteria bacterium]
MHSFDRPFRASAAASALRHALRVLAVAVLLAVPLSGAPAQDGSGAGTPPRTASEATAPSGTTADLEALSRTLRDEAARKQFLENLDALIAARRANDAKAEAPAKPGLSDRIAASVSQQVGALAARATAVLSVVREAPRLIPWAEGQVMEPRKRDRLIGIGWRFLVIVGLGMAAQFLFRKATDGTRRRLETVPEDEAMLARGVRFLGRAIMLYLNALVYGGGAYAAYLLLPMKGTGATVLLVGASSFFAAKLILATARVFLSPAVPGLRLGTFSDETAQYLYLWVRRLVRIFVYAFFLLEAVRLVGLPGPAHESLMYIVGFAFAGFVIVFVMQNRAAVAQAIRGRAQSRVAGGAFSRVATIWHFAAILYIAAVYLAWLIKVRGGFEFLMMASGWTALILVLARVVVLIANRGIDQVMRMGTDIVGDAPGVHARANRYMTVLRVLTRWAVGIAAVLLVLRAWGLDTLGWLGSPDGVAAIEKAIVVVIIVVLAVLAWEAINLAIARYIRRLDSSGNSTARVRTLLPLMRTTAMVILVTLAGLIALSELGINIAPLLAGAGVLGLAVGFGSQKLVQDVITGLFILVEDTLAVGDVVRFDADHAGVVEALSIRTVKLRDLAGNVHTLPFSEVKTVLNMTKDFAYYVFDVGVAYRENVDDVISTLKDISAEMEKDKDYGAFIAEPLEVLGLDKFADSAVVIKVRLKIIPPIKQWTVGREFNRRMKARFDAEGIEIPFPHQTIYFGEDRAGNAPPVRVASVSPSPEKS